MYCIAIKEKKVLLGSYWKFINCTLRQIAQPLYGEEFVYNRWKRKHYLKYQAIVASNSIFTHLYKLIEGCIHDSTV
ncbi:hypothetical protein L873DRAFT_1692696 [Choiromyces venosus 120613-1]|uniref:DDE Tnp4 domain-containing protein n=1 Tax=Choiromyces venosus 120613-1 TaxID=1336337 RepID=A0A3N4JJ24_9PEZI|nr:hypothetical protein L873DRAFT_1692696 [Choiromyces venosus 120613-1]